jgi:hypothetical protein
MALCAIARHLDLDRNAVRRYAHAATWQRVAPIWPRRVGILAPCQGYLHRRWAEGERNMAGLAREAIAPGFCGGKATLRLCTTSHREALDTGLPRPNRRGAPSRSPGC